jgi:uncharacterized protein involved in type VI secretion and phage assembly
MNSFDSLSTLNDRMLQLVSGVYIGIVTNNNDPEKLGRVKVKIPVLDDKTELDWARVAVLSAGADRGTVFIPDVNDEVLVAFLLGDLRQPVVIGSLWNHKKKPPASQKKEAPYQIRSRKGHEILMDDDDNDGKIVLKTKAGHQIEMSDKQGSVQLKDKSGQTITMKSNAVEITSGSAKVTIKGGNVSIETPSSVKIKGSQLSIQADASLEIKANASLKLTSSGIVELKGSMVKIN